MPGSAHPLRRRGRPRISAALRAVGQVRAPAGERPPCPAPFFRGSSPAAPHLAARATGRAFAAERGSGKHAEHPDTGGPAMPLFVHSTSRTQSPNPPPRGRRTRATAAVLGALAALAAPLAAQEKG